MILSPTDSTRFYQIWWPLLKFVNAQENVVDNFPKDPYAEGVNPQVAVKIRDILWNLPGMLDGFIRANPAGLPEKDLQLAASWRHRLQGQFIIMRHLKKYSIFLHQEEPPSAFGVLGIMSPLEEIIERSLPIIVEAVLLPFEGKIIFDGLISSRNIYFGPGYRRSFNNAYRTAQELYGIKTSLTSGDSIEELTDAVAKGNQKILLAFRKDLAISGLGESKLEEHYATVESFVKTYLSQSIPPCSLLNIKVDDLDGFFSQQGKKTNRVSFKRLVRFLLNSERIDWETAKALENFLKPKP